MLLVLLLPVLLMLLILGMDRVERWAASPKDRQDV